MVYIGVWFIVSVHGCDFEIKIADGMCVYVSSCEFMSVKHTLNRLSNIKIGAVICDR